MTTTVLIGTDEAGYGPNLGPLTICGSRWLVESSDDHLNERLQRFGKTDSAHAADGHIQIGDSKQIHRPNDLSRLELPVLAMIHSATGQIPQTFEALLQEICNPAAFPTPENPGCISARNLNIPVACNREKILNASRQFSASCDHAGIKLVSLRGRVIYPAKFNSLLVTFGNKANLLSSNTLQIVKDLVDSGSNPQVFRIFCDKHGGRDRYGALIGHWLTDQFVSVACESEERSVYQYYETDRHFEISFRARGESLLPIAVSSMIAKYLRELSMTAWNRFWQQHLPHLAPTKGYPMDAKRFIADIAEVRNALEIPLETVWRSK